jgi:hypothetical protein
MPPEVLSFLMAKWKEKWVSFQPFPSLRGCHYITS